MFYEDYSNHTSKGMLSYHTGEKYIGGFKHGIRDGHGTFLTSKGGKYIGNWEDGKYHGLGSMIMPNSLRWVGEWKEGKRDGQGAFFQMTETLQSGVWEKDKFMNELPVEEVDEFLKSKYPDFVGLIDNE